MVWTWGKNKSIPRRSSNHDFRFPSKKDINTNGNTNGNTNDINNDTGNGNNDDDEGLPVSGDIRIEVSFSKTIAYSFFIWLNTG